MSNLNLNIESLGYRWKGIYSDSLAYAEKDVVYRGGGAYVLRNGMFVPFALGQQDAAVKGALLTGGNISTGVAGQALFANADGSIGFRFADDRNGTQAIAMTQMWGTRAAPTYAPYCMSFVMSDGSVRALGYNGDGGLGDGSTNSRSFPVRAAFPPGTPRIKSITATYNSHYAIDVNGGLWFWGYSAGLMSGCNIGTDVRRPVLINGNSGPTGIPANAVITKVFTSSYEYYSQPYCIALDSQGYVYHMGYNGYGTRGDGTTTNSPWAYRIPVGNNSPIVNVFPAGGSYQGCAMLDANGDLWCIGESGQMPTWSGTTVKYQHIQYGRRVKKIFSTESDDHAVAGSQYYQDIGILFEDGDVYIRGSAGAQTRGGFTHSTTTPFGHGTPELTNVDDFFYINGSYERAVALMKDKTVKMKGYMNAGSDWGYSQNNLWNTITPLTNITKVRVMGGQYQWALWFLDGDGKLFTSGAHVNGSNGYGGSDAGAHTLRLPFLVDKPIIDFAACGYCYESVILTTYALCADGSAYVAGAGTHCRNGDDDGDNYHTPIQIRF